MNVNSITTQSFNAKIVGLKPIADRAAKEGMPKAAIERAVEKIQQYFPDRKDSIIIAQPQSIFVQPTGVGVQKGNGVFRFTEIQLNDEKNDLYKIVSAVKKLSKAEFSKELDFFSIDK